MRKSGSDVTKPSHGGGISADDSFQEIHSADLADTASSTASSSLQSSSRGIVSSIFNTLRQRKVNPTDAHSTTTAATTPGPHHHPHPHSHHHQEKDNVSLGSVSSSTSYFKNKYLGENIVSAASKTVNSRF